MNVSAPFPGSRKKESINANDGGTTASARDQNRANNDGSQRDFTTNSLGGAQRSRLINAACKAFFARRGLCPDGYGPSLNRFPSTRVPLTTLPGYKAP